MLSELFAPVSALITDLILTFGYFGITTIAFTENVIAPIPSEFVFPWAGFLAQKGDLNIWLIALSGATGSVLAALLLYYLGSKFSGPKTRRFIDKYGKYLFIKLEDIERAEKWFEKYGIWTVLIFRMVPLGRTVISIPAGFTKMNIFTFITLTFIGTFLWSFLLTYTGFLLGENWTVVSEIVSSYENAVIGLVILIGIIAIIKKLKKATSP